MYAHYFATRGTKIVIITNNVRPVGGVTINVSGVREARKVASAHDAKAYNF